jgi:hypothetical protein
VTILENERTIEEKRLTAIRNAIDHLKELDVKVRAIPPHVEFDGHASTNTGNGTIHPIEMARIDFVRIWTALHPERMHEGSNTKTGTFRESRSIVPEIESIGICQMFRIGLAFFLPLILAILSAAALVSASIVMVFSK